MKNDLREQVIAITKLLALTIADEGEAYKGAFKLDDEELYLEEEIAEDDKVYIGPTLEEQLADVGMSIHDFI